MQPDPNESLPSNVYRPKHNAVGWIYSRHNEEYPLKAVLADIVDNSIDADATRISIELEQCVYPPGEKELPNLEGDGYFALICDNGSGISNERLREALSIGNRREYGLWELGHYGVGLKESGFSQAFEITVFSKQNGGDVNILRYSSCAIYRFEEDNHLPVEGIEEHFPWMLQTQGWNYAMEHMDSITHGTAILLEGMHKLHDDAETDTSAVETRFGEIQNTCRNFLRLTFERYIRDGGYWVELPEPSERGSKVHREVEMEFNDVKLTPLNPFSESSTSDDDSYGTLTSTHQIPTNIRDQPVYAYMTIFILPNITHPDYKQEREKQEDDLASALEKGAYGLQGIFWYRNGRLIDACGVAPWKQVYSEVDNQRTHMRWRFDLPVSRDIGGSYSEFRINKSKLSCEPKPRIVRTLKNLSQNERRVWHEHDPEYPIGLGKRAKMRLNNDNGRKTNQQRFGSCHLCGSYKHKRESHSCSLCGNAGTEHTCCLPTCGLCGGLGHSSNHHRCSVCGLFGHEGDCIQPSEPAPIEPGMANEQGQQVTRSPSQTILSKVTEGDLVTISENDGVSILEVNVDHEEFDTLLEQFKALFFGELNLTIEGE